MKAGEVVGLMLLLALVAWGAFTWLARPAPRLDIVTVLEWDAAPNWGKYACYCYERDEATGRRVSVYGYAVSDISRDEARAKCLERLEVEKRREAARQNPEIEVIRK
jgi:hypothetical protein